MRDVTNMQGGRDVRIVSCEDSYLYIGTNVDCLVISKCVNCVVFVAAVTRSCTLEKCENVTLTVAASYLRIGNCVDCQVYTYSQLSPPVIYGDTRSLQLAPHNASYQELGNTLRDAGINWREAGSLEQRLSYFSKPHLMRVPRQAVALIPPLDFMKMALPKKFGDAPLFLCPQEFSQMMQLRTEKFLEVQQKIKAAGLSSEQEKMLHVAIQGYFREWFVQTSNYKQITEMVKIID